MSSIDRKRAEQAEAAHGKLAADYEAMKLSKWALEAALAERDRTIERLWAVIGSVTAHNRVFGAHIAAAMKKHDLRARAAEGGE